MVPAETEPSLAADEIFGADVAGDVAEYSAKGKGDPNVAKEGDGKGEGKGKGKGKGEEEGKGEGEEEGEGEEDGVRVVWDSAPPPSVRKQRSAWANADLREKLTWTQTSSEVIASISLPPGTCAKDCRVQITPTRLAISLSW